MRSDKRGFTLVELLVVIGIIAVLISILLPALNAVRRQAASVKCMASLREIANACRMYVEENRGAAVPLRVGGSDHTTATRKPYNLYGVLYGGNNEIAGQETQQAAWWMSFIAKYVTSTRGGTADQSRQSTSLNQRTVLWGCPNWTGTKQAGFMGAYSDMDVHTTGYSINYMPTYTPSYPAQVVDFPPDVETLDIIIDNTSTVQTTKCTWWKFTKYSNPGSRALFADCYSSVLEAKAAPTNLTIPGQPMKDTKQYANGTGVTTFDFYRHGVLPPVDASNNISATGGKVSFNILYADGHVANITDRTEAYRSIRMRYPG